MTHDILYYSIQVGLSLLGSLTYIFLKFKLAADKFDGKRANFPAKKFAKENVWDFIFYILSGFVMLTIKSVVRSYVGIEEITDHGLSCISGLLGAIIIQSLLNKIK